MADRAPKSIGRRPKGSGASQLQGLRRREYRWPKRCILWQVPEQRHRPKDGLVLIRNLYKDGKTEVKQVECAIEPDLLYPLVRGRDVDRWSVQSSCYVVLAQDPVKRIGYEEGWMKQKLPRTLAYLKEFEQDLKTKRRSHSVRDLMARGAFYSMYSSWRIHARPV